MNTDSAICYLIGFVIGWASGHLIPCVLAVRILRFIATFPRRRTGNTKTSAPTGDGASQVKGTND